MMLRWSFVSFLISMTVSAVATDPSWSHLGQVRPLFPSSKAALPVRAMTLLDVDGDYRQDLALLQAEGQGVVIAIHPRRTSETEPLGPMSVRIELPIDAEMLAAGDLNGDGYPDLVVAKRGDHAIWIVPSNGANNYDPPYTLVVDGKLQHLLIADLGRVDRLPELVLVTEEQVQIFGGPKGALSAEARSFMLEAPIDDLAVTRLDDDSALDLVLASDQGLMVVFGSRQHPASLEAEAPARVAHFLEGRAIVALTDLQQRGLVLLSAEGELQRMTPFDGSTKRPGLSTLDQVSIDTRRPALYSGFVGTGGATVLLDRANGLNLYGLDGKQSRHQLSTGMIRDLLTTRLDRDAYDDLILLDEQGQLQVITAKFRATLSVTTTEDTDDGVCDLIDCSLREAIALANTNPGVDTISFGQLEYGDFQIDLASALPEITDPVNLDGGTHPRHYVQIDGSAVATESPGIHLSAGGSLITEIYLVNHPSHGMLIDTNGNNVIELCRFGLSWDDIAKGNMGSGLMVRSDDNTIGGATTSQRNVFSGNFQHGLVIENADGNIVSKNFIGTNRQGLGSRSNSMEGMRVTNATNTLIGLPDNRFANKQSDGLLIQNSQGVTIADNLFGVDEELSNQRALVIEDSTDVTVGGNLTTEFNWITYSLAADKHAMEVYGAASSGIMIIGNKVGFGRPNQGGALLIEDTSDVQIGGPLAENENIFSHNLSGITITGNNSGNQIGRNQFYRNVRLAIDLGGDGVTANDPGDADSGTNRLLNYPVLDDVTVASNGDITIDYHLDIDPLNATYPLDVAFYRADDSVSGEGEAFFFQDQYTAADFTNGSRQIMPGTNIGLDLYLGDDVVALVTDADGNSSEFSMSQTVGLIGGFQYMVNSTNDVDDGTCDATHCSFREAILASNASVGSTDRILFDLPTGSLIQPTTRLPNIEDSVYIDGTDTVTGEPGIFIDAGMRTTTPFYGLYSASGNAVIKGLAIDGFRTCIRLESDNNIILGNYLGFDGSGGTMGGVQKGVEILGSGNRIGGSGLGEGNVIGHMNQGVYINFSDATTVIRGNRIGTDPTGTEAAPVNIGIYSAAYGGLVIGGEAAGEGNLVSGGIDYGISFQNATEFSIIGNLIGTNLAGDMELANTRGIYVQSLCQNGTVADNLVAGGRSGILVYGSDVLLHGNKVGTDITGTLPIPTTTGLYFRYGSNSTLGLPDSPNLIAYNQTGVELSVTSFSTGIDLIHNQFRLNGKGIDMDADVNDAGDADTGPNNRQNHPLLSEAYIDKTGDLYITYAVDSDPGNSQYPLRVSFYGADSGVNGQGERFLGLDYYANADFLAGNKTINLGNAVALGMGPLEPVTSMATDDEGNSSQFGNILVLAAGPQTFVVNTLLDENDGRCTAEHCSLREAIDASNYNAGELDTISFNIAGVGPHEFVLQVPLPPLTEAAILDGTTQPGYSGTPLLVIEGNDGLAEGLVLDSDDSEVYGLAITGFETGMKVMGNNNLIDGCYLGVDPDGLTAGPNDLGMLIEGNQNQVGDQNGNLFSGNRTYGLEARGNDNTIHMASVGLDHSGNSPLANVNGVLTTGNGNLIDQSHIAGNTYNGVTMQGENNQLLGSLIGPDTSGEQAIGHLRAIVLQGTGNEVGDGTEAGRNVISGNLTGIDCGGTGWAIRGNYIGLTPDGESALGNQSGILIRTTINDAFVIDRNTLSGNELSLFILEQSDKTMTFTGNQIGTNGAGDSALPNESDGILIDSCENLMIGGENAGNTISGNDQNGIRIVDSSDVQLAGFQIGLSADGNMAIPNRLDGIEIERSQRIYIGGDTTAHANTISGNLRRGIRIHGTTSTAHLIRNNRIGTNVGGDAAVGNQLAGIAIFEGEDHQVDANLVSGNGRGIFLTGALTLQNRITGNFVGTDISGTTAIGNLSAGIEIENTSLHTIGGSEAGEGNLISGNLGAGVLIRETGSLATVVQGNLIGTNAAGDGKLGNQTSGVYVDGTSNVMIGGDNAGEGNTLSGNDLHGIHLQGKASVNITVAGNAIGTDSAGVLELGNLGHGVYLDQASNAVLGGTHAPNTIAYNEGDGVRVSEGIGNRISGNPIYDNFGLGIELNGDGVDGNDVHDLDGGANRSQNHPVLSLVDVVGGNTEVEGTLSSRPETSYTLDFYSSPECDPSGYGEGQTYLGSLIVTTDLGGIATFDTSFSGELAPGHVVSATATDGGGNTSEFGACEERVLFSDGFESGDLRAWRVTQNRGVVPEVLDAAHYGGDYGLQLTLSGAATAWLSDDTPGDEANYRARFYGRFDQLVLPVGEELILLETEDDGGTVWARLILIGTVDGLAVTIEARNDDGSEQRGVTYPLNNGWRRLEIALRARDEDGSLVLLEGGHERITLHLDNANARVDETKLGIIESPVGASGFVYLDDFKSNRNLPLGGLPCSGTTDFYESLPGWGTDTNILNLIATLSQSCQ